MRAYLSVVRYVYLPLVLLIIAGCTPLPLSTDIESTATIKTNSEHIPTAPETQPTPNQHPPNPTPSLPIESWIDPTTGTRTWIPSGILIQAGTVHTQMHAPFNTDPWFLLYSDGMLVIKECTGLECNTIVSHLNTQDICRLLNTIDAIGFNTYDPSTYAPPIVGGEITYIEVSAWYENRIALYQLEDWIEDPLWLDRLLQCDGCRKPPIISPSLFETYLLLKSYIPRNPSPYQSTRLAVWLSPNVVNDDPNPWQLNSPSLSRLSEMSMCPDGTSRRVVVLVDSEAQRVSSYINSIANQGFAPVFVEDSLVYEISTRWMIPHELAAGCGAATNIFHPGEATNPPEEMTCHMADGILPTSTSTWIP